MALPLLAERAPDACLVPAAGDGAPHYTPASGDAPRAAPHHTLAPGDATHNARAAGDAPRVTERKRILLAVHSAKAGGAERMALLEAQQLEGHFELLISVPEGPLRARFAAHGELVAPAATLPLWGASAGRWARSAARTAIDAVRMALVIRRRGVQLVLTNSSVCLAPVLAARLARVPVVVHARDVPKSRLAPLVFALHGALADTVVVIASGLTPYFARGRRARIARIADGILAPQSPPSATPRSLRAPLRICLVGGLDPRKGQDVAVAALAQLRDSGVEATLELVGREVDREFAASVHDAVQRLDLTERVEFVGEVPDAGPHLERADIAIAPSRGEWTPLVLMEALARGLPVVAARVGGVEEIVSDRESGLLVPPGDPTALADAIRELLADPRAAMEMARRGGEHVEANFRVERTLERLQAELGLLIADASPPTRERGPAPAVL
jgi:glycosyltransferase involved in cell wall biosynthesis